MASTGATSSSRGTGPSGLHGPRNLIRKGKLRHTRLNEHLPIDHRLSKIYRVGAGVMGLLLLVFGILGLIDRIGFFDTGGDTVAGLNTNGALSVLSIVVGVILFVGMVIGGNFASTLNIVLGALFLLSGFVNLALLRTEENFLAFKIQNVLFSFVVGLMLLVFGMYGRVSGGLAHDNPYWRTRHPEATDRAARRRMRPATATDVQRAMSRETEWRQETAERGLAPARSPAQTPTPPATPSPTTLVRSPSSPSETGAEAPGAGGRGDERAGESRSGKRLGLLGGRKYEPRHAREKEGKLTKLGKARRERG